MADRPPFSQLVTSLPSVVPFVPPEEMERKTGISLRLRLGANESSFGMSPQAEEAMKKAVEMSHLYGDALCHDLRQALADVHSISPDQLVFGSGIDELLGLITRVFLNPGDAVTTSLGGYPTFEYHVKSVGAQLHHVPYQGDFNDLDGLIRTAEKTGSRILYLANPDNPTGSFFSHQELRAFLNRLPSGCLLLLDEAYLEFAPSASWLPIDASDPRIIRTRTFSKAYGMAGARIGYAIAEAKTVQAFDKIRNHFGINRVAQAGALASLKDESFLTFVTEEVAKGRKEYATLADELGLRAISSATNFVAIDVGSADRARGIMDALWKEGVFIRVPGVPPLNQLIRVGVGTSEERQAFADTLRQVVKSI